MDLEPRRVSIEREEEWIKIKQNITDATQVYIREYLKENGMESNAVLKAEMEDLIARRLQYAFDMCVSNLQINGYDYEDYLELTEPFNEPLDRALWSLNASAAEHTAGTASKRRTIPTAIENNELAMDDARCRGEWRPVEVEGDSKREDKMDVDVPIPARQAETVATFKSTVDTIQTLTKTTASLVSRAERAKLVQEQVKALPK